MMICGNLRCLAAARRQQHHRLSSQLLVSWCRLDAARRGLAALGTSGVDPPPKKPKQKVSYSETLNLPKSQFPMKHSRQLELELEKRAQFSDLYKDEAVPVQQSEKRRTFILHDGPPYANGDAHFGHCINKTLKDIFLKRQLLATGDVDLHYVPGWDCHGLPIELKALTEDQAQQLSPLEVRSRARQLATSAMDRQRASFSRWYLQGDLGRPYRTFDLQYSLTELEAFYRLYAVDRLIFRDLMPVYWSPSTRTALAEAELQYNPGHLSLAAYIRFEVVGGSFDDGGHHHSKKTYALIWTTTPWTLLANEGVAFSETIDYSLVTGLMSSAGETDDDQYLVATELVPALREKIPNSSIQVLRSGITGTQLTNLRYLDPLSPNQPKPFLASEHVSLGKGGTGLVHLAPNHGFDDYKLFQSGELQYRKKSSIVDGLGRLILPPPYENEPPIPITTTTTTSGNLASSAVLERLLAPLGAVVHSADHQHPYPYDWRSGQPVLIRPSSQWFLRMEGPLRERCLQALDGVKMVPEKLRREFARQLATRPNWCLSRQRHWGVPIPVFYEGGEGGDPDRLRPILDEKIFRRVMDTFRREGLDAWWSRSAEELAGAPEGRSPLVKSEDIFDIWFDSGCSWLAVLPKNSQNGLIQADLYSEGVDQIRGWFQSSLITGVALQGAAPYKAVFIHGFALDREGKKMSKSVGNVVDPDDIVEDRDLGKYLPVEEKEEEEESSDPKKWSKKKKKHPMKKKSSANGNCGLDGLRLWIAKHACSHNDVSVDVAAFSEDILSTVNRLRNTFRFLLGVLAPNGKQFQFQASPLLPSHQFSQLPLMDRYLLMRVAALQSLAESAYRNFDLGALVEGGVLRTVLHEVATFYLSRVKDRLYCEDPKKRSYEDEEDSVVGGYQAAWTVLWAVYHTAGHVLAPITPHLILEANETLPFSRRQLLFPLKTEDGGDVDRFVQKVLFPEGDGDGGGPQSEQEFTQRMAPALRIIETLNRWTGTASSSSHRLMEYDLLIATEDEQVLRTLKFLQPRGPQRTFTSDLAELLQVASVRYQERLFDDCVEDEEEEGDGGQKRRYRLRPTVEVQEEEGGEGGESTVKQVVESKEFELELRPTRLLLCPRCRRHTVWPNLWMGEEVEEEKEVDCLCDRCQTVIKSS